VVVPGGREGDGRRRRQDSEPAAVAAWPLEPDEPRRRRVANSGSWRGVVRGDQVWTHGPHPSDVEPVGARTRSPWVRLPSLVALGFIRAAAPQAPHLTISAVSSSSRHQIPSSSSRHPSPWVVALSCPGSPCCSIYDLARRVLLTCFLLLFVLLAGFGDAGKIKIGINGEFLRRTSSSCSFGLCAVESGLI
jgi:hypothetical protein